MAATSPLSTTTTIASSTSTLRTQKRATSAAPKVKFLAGLNNYHGLSIHNNLIATGKPVSTEQCFAKFASSMSSSNTNGGALSSTCNVAVEIFKIASIMNGLVLVGVAVGFALLRIEASVEEAESD